MWTPPRDTVIPPVPWRAIAAGTIVLLVLLGTAAAIVIPRVVEDRETASRRSQRAEAERHAAFLTSVGREQRPHRGFGRADPGADAPAARRTQTRTALVSSAESGIADDARGRTRKRIRGVDCEPFPRSLEQTAPANELSRPAATYQCVAVTSRFGSRSLPGGRGIIGISFRLIVHFDTGRFAWCRIVPLSDRDRLTNPLPRACRLKSPVPD
jgi:hypothetical protein